MNQTEPAPEGVLDLQNLAVRSSDPGVRAQLVSGVHQVVRRYCRALLGRSARGFGRADELAETVATTILREHQDDFGGSVPAEAIVYADMAPAVARALGERVRPPAPPGPVVTPEQVQERLGRLPARAREVLVLRAFVGLSSEQVGRALGLTQDDVREEQQLAMSHLRSV